MVLVVIIIVVVVVVVLSDKNHSRVHLCILSLRNLFRVVLKSLAIAASVFPKTVSGLLVVLVAVVVLLLLFGEGEAEDDEAALYCRLISQTHRVLLCQCLPISSTDDSVH
jgi:hypothetical protein